MELKLNFYTVTTISIISVIYAIFFIIFLFSTMKIKTISTQLNDFKNSIANDKDMHRLLITIDENKPNEMKIQNDNRQAELFSSLIKNKNIETTDHYVIIRKTIYKLKKMHTNPSNYTIEVDHVDGIKEYGTFVADVLLL